MPPQEAPPPLVTPAPEAPAPATAAEGAVGQSGQSQETERELSLLASFALPGPWKALAPLAGRVLARGGAVAALTVAAFFLYQGLADLKDQVSSLRKDTTAILQDVGAARAEVAAVAASLKVESAARALLEIKLEEHEARDRGLVPAPAGSPAASAPSTAPATAPTTTTTTTGGK